MRSFCKIIFVLSFLLIPICSLLSANGGKSYAEEITKIIAKVNSQIITSKDLDDYCNSLALKLSDNSDEISENDNEFRQEALRRFIEDKLVIDEAKKEGIKISDSAIEGKIGGMIAAYNSRDEFEKDLFQRGLTMSILRDKIRDQYLMREIIDQYVRSKVQVSPQEISDYYNQNKDKFYSPDIYVFYMASSSDADQLKEIFKAIEQDGILSAKEQYDSYLVRIESIKEDLREDIVAFLEDLKPGEYRIKKIDREFYLIYFEDIVKPRLLALSEVKESIYNYLWSKEFKRIFDDWVKELKGKAVIKVYHD